MASGARNARSLRSAISEANQHAVEARLGELSMDLNGAALVAPRAEFVDALRTRLMAVAAVAPEPAPKRTINDWALSSARSARRVRFATSLVAAGVVVGSAGVAGARSLPGDPFYDVKQASESLQLTFTQGDAAKGQLHLKFAQRRLNELVTLSHSSPATLTAAGSTHTESLTSLAGVSKSTLKDIRRTLKAMDRETTAGAALLATAFQHTQDRAVAHTLGSFAQAQAARLQTVVGNLPSVTQPEALNSLSIVFKVQSDAFILAATAPLTADSSSTPADAPTVIPTLPALPNITKTVKPLVSPFHRATTTGSAGSADVANGSTTPEQNPSAGGNGTGSGTPSTPTGNPATPTTVTVKVPLGVNTCLDVTTAVGLPPVCIADTSKK